ncbi:acetyl-CoA carboxylase biotin carboxyl carrier protein subunit [Streptomyces griseocarneus]|nr:acetyl-CoA carboxylase biotin carboxyl carrier protein subunit [Streptomyces griseocarneus]
MSGERQVIRIVRGNPDATELAAVVSLLCAGAAPRPDGETGGTGRSRPAAPWARGSTAPGWSSRPLPGRRPVL